MPALFDRILEETRRLDAISAGTSGANYDAAFQSAFDALFGQPADCQKVILFMSDGEPTTGKTEQDLMTAYQGFDTGYKILTYSHDDGSGGRVTEYLQRLACQHDGVHYRSAGGSNNPWRSVVPHLSVEFTGKLLSFPRVTRKSSDR